MSTRNRLAPIEFVRGDTKQFRINPLRDKVTKEPVNVTGATITSQVRVSADDNSVVATATGSIVDGPGGVFTVVFPPSETANIGADGVFDIQVALSTGETFTLWPNRKVKAVLDVSR